MSSAGHVQDMNNRMRQNRAALNSKKAKFKERKRFNIKYEGSGVVVDDIDLSKEELAQIKSEIREEIRAERIGRWVKVVFLVVLIVGSVLSLVFHYLFY